MCTFVKFLSFHVYVLGGGTMDHIFDETFWRSLYRREVKRYRKDVTYGFGWNAFSFLRRVSLRLQIKPNEI